MTAFTEPFPVPACGVITGECVQRSCGDLRSAKRLTATNTLCDSELMLPPPPPPRLNDSAVALRSPSRCRSSAVPNAVVEILPPRPPPDDAGSGPPWTDSVVRRSKGAASSPPRRTLSFPPPCLPPLPSVTAGSDSLHRKFRRRRDSDASSPAPPTCRNSADAQSTAATAQSADNLGVLFHQQTSLDYNDDVTDDRMTSEVTSSSSPPTVDDTEKQ